MFQSVVHIDRASEYILAVLASTCIRLAVCVCGVTQFNHQLNGEVTLTLKQRKNLFINYSNEKLLLTPSHIKSSIL